MPNLNSVQLMGNATRDPELRHTANNNAVVNIGMAINRTWKNQAGEKQEETTFVDIEAWGRLGEIINQYVGKGDPFFIGGRLKLDQWQDQQGQNRSKLKVVAENLQLLSRGGGGGQQQQSRQPSASAQQSAAAYAGGAHDPIDDSEIPFHHDASMDF